MITNRTVLRGLYMIIRKYMVIVNQMIMSFRKYENVNIEVVLMDHTKLRDHDHAYLWHLKNAPEESKLWRFQNWGECLIKTIFAVNIVTNIL